MKRVLLWVVVAIFVLGGVGYAAFHAKAKRPATATAQYATAKAFNGPISENVTGTGTIEAKKSIDIYAKQQGTAGPILVSVGSQVKKGQVLTRLDDGGALATQVADARAQLASDEATLAKDTHPTPPTAPAIQAQQERIASDTARIASDQHDLSLLSIDAPAAGTVNAVQATVGQIVSTGAPLFSIEDSQNIEVKASVPQTNLSNIHPGQPASVSLPNFPTTPAIVVSVGADSTGSDSTGSLYPVTFQMTRPPQGLKNGMQASISDPSDNLAATGSIYIPQATVVDAPISGTVTQVSVSAGQAITQGAPAVQLKNASLQTTLASDEATLAQDRSSLYDLQHPTPPDAATLVALNAKIEADKATLSQAGAALGQLVIQAPMVGVITSVDIDAGRPVSPGTQAFSEIDQALQAKVPIDAVNEPKLTVGQKGTINSDAFPQTSFTGIVQSINPVGTNSNGVATFDVILNIPQPGGLKPGMSESTTIEVANQQKALLVPVEAVTLSPNGATVQELKNGSPVTVPVKVGLSNDVNAQILSGLSAGDVVITAKASTSSGLFRRPSGGGGPTPSGRTSGP